MYWSIYYRNNAWNHIKIRLYYLHFVFDPSMISQRWMDHFLYYYVEWLNGSSIVRWLFKNRNFVWKRLNLLLIFGVYQLLVTWKTAERMLQIMWADFWGQIKKVRCWKGFKNKWICVQSWRHVGNTKEKWCLLILNWGTTI